MHQSQTNSYVLRERKEKRSGEREIRSVVSLGDNPGRNVYVLSRCVGVNLYLSQAKEGVI